MIDNINTYWAKELKIKALWGSRFSFKLNLLDNNGDKYHIPDGHVAYFGVFRPSSYNSIFGASLLEIENNQDNDYYSFETLITGDSEGDRNVIVVDPITTNDDAYSKETRNLFAPAGMYKYVLFTYDPSVYPSIITNLGEDVPNNFLSVALSCLAIL